MRFYYKCSLCGVEYDIKPNIMVCPLCSEKQKQDEPLRGVLETVFEGVPRDLLIDLLPVEKEYFPPIPVGSTPLWEPLRLRKSLNFPNLFLKDDTLNPTGSLKDRASYLVAAFARKHQIRDIAVASTGNAASSMAGIGAAGELKVTIFIPRAAPRAKMVQALQYGAEVILVDGNYDRAFDLSLGYSRTKGFLSRNTAYNPLTLEGKKTAALEIYLQLQKAPDYLFVPTGDGVILGGIYRGFENLIKLGRIDSVPLIFAVQAEGSCAITRVFSGTQNFGKPVPSKTIADSIAVDVPKNGYHAVGKLKQHAGRCVTVTDQEILSAQFQLASSAGLFAEPSSSAAFAGFLKVKEELDPEKSTVLLITGSGLKDIETAQAGVVMPREVQ